MLNNFNQFLLGSTALILCCFVTDIQSYAASEFRQPIPRNELIIIDKGLRNKRNVPEPMLDPYSILGFLSFATFIFSILYNQYKMKPSKPSGSDNPGGPPMFFQGLDSQKNVDYVFKMAKKILQHAAQNSQKLPTADADTLDATDYYDSVEGDGVAGQSQEKTKTTA